MALKFITIHDSEPKVNNFVVPPIQVLLYKAFNKRNDGVGSKTLHSMSVSDAILEQKGYDKYSADAFAET